MKYISHNEDETILLADKFAQNLQPGDIVCLWGDLGVGKSVFCRAVIRSLLGNNDIEVPSPTFTLVQNYDILAINNKYNKDVQIWHFDLYRISDEEEIYEIGWEEALASGISLIEWPEKLGDLLPERRIDITITNIKGHVSRREINIEYNNEGK